MRLALALFVLVVAGVQAFVPTRTLRNARHIVPRMGLDGMLGVGPETGHTVWDPLSLGSLSDTIKGEHSSVMPHAKWLREAEIKHGRAAMLAFVGTMAAATGVVFPGELGGFHYEPCAWYDGLGSAVSTNSFGMAQLFLSIALIEGASFPGEFWTGGGEREAGDLGFLPFGNAEKNKRNLDEMKISELKNGRLAMIAMAGLFAEHQLPGSVPLIPGV